MKFVLSRTSTTDSSKINVDDKKYKIKTKRLTRKGFFDIENVKDDVNIIIKSLEELMEWQKDYLDLIIMNNYDNENLKEIEIYDDYRE